MEYQIQELKQIIAIQQDVIYDLSEKLAKERISRMSDGAGYKSGDTFTIPVKYVSVYEPPING